MNTRGYSRIVAAAVVGWVVLVTGCGKSSPASDTGTSGSAGVYGSSYQVTVYRSAGGTITSDIGGINCGTVATACGPVSIPWSQPVTLTATPDAGKMLGAWAGDCTGNAPTCVLSTTPYGSDKYVVPVWGPAGQTQHPNFSDNAVHGPAFITWQTGKDPNAYQCTVCHGTTYNGMGIAPSCNACHAKALGISPAPTTPDFWLNNCTFCHGAPPPPEPPGYGPLPHPQDVIITTAKCTSDAQCSSQYPTCGTDGYCGPHNLFCGTCHGTTVTLDGVTKPVSSGGTHMDGIIEGGHPAGFDQPTVHGPEFFGHAAEPSPNYCQQCHGVDYGNLIVNPAPNTTARRSCNVCHYNAGWLGGPPIPADSGWQTNCSFCHGQRNAQTQAAPYDVSQFPTRSSPPDAIAQRLGATPASPPTTAQRIGAHGIHLTGSSFSRAFACSVCHAVPSTLTHINNTRAAVAVTAPGDLTADATAYDTSIGAPTSGTCATKCHGSTIASNPPGARSPAWSFSGIACNGCHGVPPPTPDGIHDGFSMADTTVCSFCHPTTVKPDGTIDTSPAGTHINGMVDKVGGAGTYHPADWALPSNHGNQYLNTVAGVAGSLNCKGCHGASLALCTDCHSSSTNSTSTAWTSWQTNCTFCHGTRTPGYTSNDLSLSAPPDDIAQRLAGGGANNEVLTRTGQHSIHVFDGGTVPIGTGVLPCSSCHVVPTAIESANHITADRVAGVSITPAGAFPGLSAADLAKLPPTLVAYDRSALTCTGYCHGSTAWGGNNTTVIWTDDYSTPIQGCNDCHGQPPPTGRLVKTVLTNACPTTTFPNGCANHVYHGRIMGRSPYLYDSCANCHFGSANGPYNGLHVNGKTDLVYTPSGTPGFKAFTASWDPVAKTCTASCHTTSGVGVMQSW